LDYRKKEVRALIESNPLSPGVCYTATSDGENNSLVKIEVVAIKR
jgi:ATP-dependent Lon protease